ncbi:MAG: glycosyltransferase family 4 protein [Planctomycetota bacterium]
MSGTRVLLISPTLRHGGNATSARRLAEFLGRLGLRVRTLGAGDDGFAGRLQSTMEKFRPDVLHALHARKGTAAVLRHRLPGDPPLVTTLTGTEIHRDLGDPRLGAEVVAALEASAVVVAHGRALLDAACDAVPGLRPRAVFVSKGVSVPPRVPGDAWRRRAGVASNATVLLLPAGVREVKDPSFAVEPLEGLRRRFPRLAFVHCGEELDAEEEDRLAAVLGERPWAVSLGGVKQKRMGTLLRSAAVVLNTSRAEGLANSIVEGQACGRAVLASDIPANRELVRHGKTGLLYRVGDAASFARQATRLLGDTDLRRRLGRAGREFVKKHFDPRREAEAMRDVYERAIGGCSS